jgi:AraC family transcriptional regulator of adaptative response / DNA-3-methyladenine glycosylase II
VEHDRAPSAPGWSPLRLGFRAPLALRALAGFLARRTVAGVEEVAGTRYRRSLRLAGGLGVVELDLAGAPCGAPEIPGRVWLADPGDRAAAVSACRRLLDLDAEPDVVDAALGADAVLGPVVSAVPGRRAPGHVDAHELAFRAVLGQQVSLAAAGRLAGRLVELWGEPVARSLGTVTHAFPSAAAMAEADLERVGMPASRRATLRALAAALATGRVDLTPGADRDEAERRLRELPGIGPWTAAYVRMRGLGDPDVLLDSDLGIRHALARLGVERPADVVDRWRPWRSYAGHHLWATLADGT